ncbi:bacteriohemerythrin [Candidatus Latescibacterota bacterium]
MVFLKWDESLRVNIKEVDNQHVTLFEIANKLHSSLKSGQGSTILNPLLNSLVDYVKTHFAYEEKWMAKYNYPELSKQKQEHLTFVSELKNFIQKYQKRTPLLAREILLYLGGWIRKHIIENDKKFGKFLKEKKIKIGD